jgi:hypothetical protein
MVAEKVHSKKKISFRSLSILHELASDIVDCCDVVGIDSVSEAEGVSQEGRAEEDRFVTKCENRPCPGAYISGG